MHDLLYGNRRRRLLHLPNEVNQVIKRFNNNSEDLPFWAVRIHSSMAYVRYGLQVQISEPKTSEPLPCFFGKQKKGRIIHGKRCSKEFTYIRHVRVVLILYLRRT